MAWCLTSMNQDSVGNADGAETKMTVMTVVVVVQGLPGKLATALGHAPCYE